MMMVDDNNDDDGFGSLFSDGLVNGLEHYVQIYVVYIREYPPPPREICAQVLAKVKEEEKGIHLYVMVMFIYMS